ncbi:hypothetical protein [Pseudorhodoferax sp.]|uniref:hypothetical protein n=1 Tax=Pseudorhodoferax sp. TaxID=1993553 RepID=UPI002DD61BE4|nr:hypothetical protein [Pseudorhodoferax sp.]
MTLRTCAALGLAAALAAAPGCSAAPAAPAADTSARNVVRAALQLRDVPLTVHATCRQAGGDAADRTLGDYLAGLLAAMDRPGNTVAASCRAVGGTHRACTLWLRHRSEEERWAWGLAFDIDAQDRPLPASVRCLGAG